MRGRERLPAMGVQKMNDECAGSHALKQRMNTATRFNCRLTLSCKSELARDRDNHSPSRCLTNRNREQAHSYRR